MQHYKRYSSSNGNNDIMKNMMIMNEITNKQHPPVKGLKNWENRLDVYFIAKREKLIEILQKSQVRI